MKFIELSRHIKENNPQPFYVIIGDDGYLIKKATGMLIEFADGMAEFNVHNFRDSVRVSDIVASCRTIPLLGSRIVVIASSYSGDVRELVGYVKNPSKSTVLVLVIDKLTKSVSELIKLATIIECDRLDAASLQKWVIKRCETLGCTISPAVASLLISYCDRFMARIEIETDKLCSYKLGGEIAACDVEETVAASPEFKAYELCDAIAAGKKEVSMEMLNALLEASPASYLIATLYSYFRRLLYSCICKDDRTAEYLGIKEFAVSIARKNALRIGAKRIKEICDRLQEIDFEFKSGRINDTLALKTFVSSLVFELSDE